MQEPENLFKETRNELIDKIIQTYELEKMPDITAAVELYYDAQQVRIAAANRERTEGPTQLTEWFNKWLLLGEKVISAKLKKWIESEASPAEAKWAYSQIGIGPVLASGLAAHINVEKARHRSSLWKFAGLAPGFDKRVKGQTLPFNSRLKVLCWKLGESFVKVSGKEGATYGHLYAKFKAEELQKNEAGKYNEAAKKELSEKKFKENATKKRLELGFLSDAALHSRAKRKAVKMFLSHYWEIGRKARGLDVGTPYAIGILGHEHKIEPAEQ